MWSIWFPRAKPPFPWEKSCELVASPNAKRVARYVKPPTVMSLSQSVRPIVCASNGAMETLGALGMVILSSVFPTPKIYIHRS